MRDSVRPHLPLLMGQNVQITSRLCSAEQDEVLRLIHREEGCCVLLICLARQQSSSTSQATALMANRRKPDAISGRRVPDVLVSSTLK